MSSRTVLVIEDEADLANLYATWLQEDYEIRTATDGESGLAKFDDAVDIVLLDRRMPGLSGDEVLDRLKSRSEQCRVVMVTAVEPDLDIVDMPFDDYLVKPITSADLTDTIDRLATREAYADGLDEYVRLVKKKNTLETAHPDAPISESPAFKRLESRIEELEEQVDSIGQRFDDEDVTAVLRDL